MVNPELEWMVMWKFRDQDGTWNDNLSQFATEHDARSHHRWLTTESTTEFREVKLLRQYTPGKWKKV